MKLSPAQFVIATFGGVRKTAYLLNLSPASVCRWQTPRPGKKDPSGIPQKEVIRILKIAKRRKLNITLENIIYGGNLCRK